MSTAEAVSKVIEEIAHLFASAPTDEQILSFRPSDKVEQRARALLAMNRNVQLDENSKKELDQYEQSELLMRLIKAQIRARRGG